MQNNNETTSCRAGFRKEAREWRWIPLIVLGLSLVSIMILTWGRTINEKERVNYVVTRSFLKIQARVSCFHLWLEEYLQGDGLVVLGDVREQIEEAIKLAEALVRGGKVEHDLVMTPLESSKDRAGAEEIMLWLVELEELAERRLETPDTSGIDSPLDEMFDATFKRIEAKIVSLEHAVQSDQVREQAAGRRLYSTILIVWSFVVALAAIGLWNREARRRRAELALQTANEQLSFQAEELKKHRGHLMELVEERTGELTSANRELQREVVERIRVAGALEESKNTFERLSLEFRTLLDAIPDSIILVSPESKVLWANRSAASVLGEGMRDVAGLNCRRLSGNRSTCYEECPAMRAFKTGKAESIQLSATDDATWDIRAFPVKDGNGRVLNVIEVATDITEKVTLQAEALRVAHLASLGELAAGVAHEINNPINGIINYAQILIDNRHGQDEDDDVPVQIIREGERIAAIVGSLLSFARENRAQKISMHVHEILVETLSLVDKQLENDGITLRVNVPNDLPPVRANLRLMQQVFLNIVSNARYALNQKYPGSNEGKVIEISAEETAVQGRPSVAMTFLDRGVGIPSAIIHKVKDPFFTTKPDGLGTGLGLSISHGIISDHGGKLSVLSEEKEFTEVRIILPGEVGDETKNPCDR